jgi:PilZ domain
MSNNGRFAESGMPGASADRQKDATAAVSQESAVAEGARKRMDRVRYPDMQSAARFPIKLPVSVKLKSGESATETQNISANGVLFQMSSEMPVGSMVEFTISLPAEVVGSDADVHIDCRGRVVRSFEEDGGRGVGVVIDEYHFERR